MLSVSGSHRSKLQPICRVSAYDGGERLSRERLFGLSCIEMSPFWGVIWSIGGFAARRTVDCAVTVSSTLTWDQIGEFGRRVLSNADWGRK